MDVEELVYNGLIFFLISECLWMLWIQIRQLNVCDLTTAPSKEIEAILTFEQFQRVKKLAIKKCVESIGTEVYPLLVHILILACCGLRSFWIFSEKCLTSFGFQEGNALNQYIAFSFAVNFFIAILKLPIKLLLEKKLDKKIESEKDLSFSKLMLMLFTQYGLIAIVALNRGGYVIFYLGIAIGILCFSVKAYHDYIPLFLADTLNRSSLQLELKTEIDNMAKETGFPLLRVYVVKPPTWVHYVSLHGIFKNRIAVLDKVIEKCDLNEILALLAHELSLWRSGYYFYDAILPQIHIFVGIVTFYIIFEFKVVYNAFGFTETPVVVGQFIGDFLLQAYIQMAKFSDGALRRRFVKEADRFVKRQGRSKFLKQALLKLQGNDTLAFPENDPWYSRYYHTQPTLLERLRNLDLDLDKED